MVSDELLFTFGCALCTNVTAKWVRECDFIDLKLWTSWKLCGGRYIVIIFLRGSGQVWSIKKKVNYHFLYSIRSLVGRGRKLQLRKNNGNQFGGKCWVLFFFNYNESNIHIFFDKPVHLPIFGCSWFSASILDLRWSRVGKWEGSNMVHVLFL